VTKAIVNVHWLADQIEAAIARRRSASITVSDERALLLDQAGGIVKVLDAFEGRPFFICNTDALWIDSPSPQVARLREHWDGDRMDVLLLLANRAESLGVEGQGDFFMDAAGALSRPGPNEEAPYTYSGVGVIKSSLFENQPVAPMKLAPFFFDAAARGRLHGLVLQGRWLHVGTPDMIERADAAWAARADLRHSPASSKDPTCPPAFST
jgi:MurNAc alpha-1-phosphate uridylyltransferase